MKRFTKMASIFALALFVLALPSVASAQWRDRDRDRDDDYYGRDDDYNRNGRYGNRNIRGTIESLKNRARNFERRTDRMDDRDDDRYNRRVRYDNLEELADRFARATDDLADAYGRGRNMNNSRDEARRVLDIGSQIENVMYRNGGGRNRELDAAGTRSRPMLRIWWHILTSAPFMCASSISSVFSTTLVSVGSCSNASVDCNRPARFLISALDAEIKW